MDTDLIWKESNEPEASRRTIYGHVKRSMIVPMFEVLDFCDTTRSAAQRNVTSVPTQALTLFNGHFVNRQAAHLAERLVHEAGGIAEHQIDLAFRLALCRPPAADETRTMHAFLDQQTKIALKESAGLGRTITAEAAHQKALVQMCRVIFNMNEFAYPE